MAGDSSIPPPCIWAQRNDKVYLTIQVNDLQDAKIELQETTLHITGKGGVDKKNYDVTIEFYKEVDIATSKYVVQSRNIPMVIMKKDDEFWPSLMKDKKKAHWLKTDFDKWREEDDSEDEGGDDMQLEDMMKNMGNFNGGAGGPGEEGEYGEDMPEEEDDSDDEDLPDLE